VQVQWLRKVNFFHAKSVARKAVKEQRRKAFCVFAPLFSMKH